MKKLGILLVLLAITFVSYGQKKTKKLTSSQSADMTADQRYVHESQRKSNKKKKDLSMKKRVRLEEKQDRKARKIKKRY
jgi:hypothetical protein